MFNRIVQRYENLPTFAKLLAESLGIALPFYASALLSVYIENTARLQGEKVVLLRIFIFILLTIVVLIFMKAFVLAKDNLRLRERRKREAIAHAYNLTDRWITKKAELYNGTKKIIGPPKNQLFIDGFTAPMKSIRILVELLYHVFESHFADSQNLESAVEFEVTFMTKSYIDNYITIPAWANRDNRAPRSLRLRKNNPSIYESTVTAQIYRAPRPETIITEDTKSSPDYHELYAGQKNRICSSIVHPVLSHRNELLGTLVVHCNSPHFFLNQDIIYWRKLLEIFAKRIALEKMKMDTFCAYMRSHYPQEKIDLPF